MAFARAFVAFPPSSSLRPSLLFLPISHLSLPFRFIRNFTVSASSSALNSSASMEIEAPKTHRWRPMCLYYTQGRCIKMDDATHLEKFNHNYSADLKVNATCVNRLKPQDLDYLLVLDLEGRVEILEFPVLMIDARTMEFIDAFHRFVRPSLMSKQKIMEYIEGKYGRFGVDRVWHDTAIPFEDVLKEFELWMTNHHLWKKDQAASLNRAAFVTCGNWDLKTMIPKQCKISKIKMPLYFMEWINLKDIYLNFYRRRVNFVDSSVYSHCSFVLFLKGQCKNPNSNSKSWEMVLKALDIASINSILATCINDFVPSSFVSGNRNDDDDEAT